MDKIIAPLFYENGISFNVADSSSFARMIGESMRFAKQNPFHSYKAPSFKRVSAQLLDQAYKSTEQSVNTLSPCSILVLSETLRKSLIHEQTSRNRNCPPERMSRTAPFTGLELSSARQDVVTILIRH